MRFFKKIADAIWKWQSMKVASFPQLLEQCQCVKVSVDVLHRPIGGGPPIVGIGPGTVGYAYAIEVRVSDTNGKFCFLEKLPSTVFNHLGTDEQCLARAWLKAEEFAAAIEQRYPSANVTLRLNGKTCPDRAAVHANAVAMVA